MLGFRIFNKIAKENKSLVRAFHPSVPEVTEPLVTHWKPVAIGATITTGVLATMGVFAKMLHDDHLAAGKEIRQHRDEVNARLSEVNMRLDTTHADIKNLERKLDDGINRLSDKIDRISSPRQP